MIVQVLPNLSALSMESFKSDLIYENIIKSVSDGNNNVYTIDRSQKRVMMVDPTGHVGFLLEVPYNSSINYSDIAVDLKGNVFVSLFKLNDQGVRIEYEQIDQYDIFGQKVKTLYAIHYEPNQMPTRPGQISGLSMEDTNLSFFRTIDNQVSIYTIDPNYPFAKLVSQFRVPEGLYPFHFSPMTYDHSVYFTTKKAEIYRYSPNGQMLPVYSSKGQGSEPISFPLHVTVDPENRIYFTDIGLRQITRLDIKSGISIPIITEQSLRAHGVTTSFTSLKNISVNADGSLSIATLKNVIKLDQQMMFDKVTTHGLLSFTQMIPRWLIRLEVLAIVTLLAWMFYIVFVVWMKRRVSLMVKQLVFFIPVVILVTFGIAWMIKDKYTEIYKQEIFNKLKLAVHTGTQMLDVSKIEAIKKPADFMSPTYVDIDRMNKFMLRGSQNLNTEALYSALYKVENDKLYVLMYFNTSVGTYYPIDMSSVPANVLKNGTIETVISKEADGEWIYAIGPIYNKAGKLIALHEVGTNLTNLTVLENEIVNSTWRIVGVIIPIFVVIYLILTIYLLAPLQVLRRKVSEMGEGKLDSLAEFDSNDEVADLGNHFNDMALKIRNHIEEVEELSASYFRFVPQQFLTFLNKKNILEVQLGNHVQQEMTLMIFQVRDFYEVTHGMTANENFQFIKSILGYFGPIISNNNGFISKYLADGALSIFPATTESAVQAALEIRLALQLYNKFLKEKNLPMIEISIAVHSGSLMLGIIGEEKRLEGSVISDDVNLLTLIQQQSATVGSSFLLTSHAYDRLKDPKKFKYRSLGDVQLQGVSETLALYDFYEGDQEEQLKMKHDTKVNFERSIEMFKEGRYYDARKGFLNIIKQNRFDQTAKLYFYLCDLYFQQGSPDKEGGVLTYDIRTK